jgi:hypothetical protein
MSFFTPPSVFVFAPPPPQPANAKTRIDATRSARTLGWGEPMVIGGLSTEETETRLSARRSVSGKGRFRRPDPEIILRAAAKRIYDHL